MVVGVERLLFLVVEDVAVDVRWLFDDVLGIGEP